MEIKKDAVKITEDSKKYAQRNLHDIVIIDTAGRLHIDEIMMKELEEIKKYFRTRRNTYGSRCNGGSRCSQFC